MHDRKARSIVENHLSVISIDEQPTSSVCSLCPIDHKLSLLRMEMITMTITVIIVIFSDPFRSDLEEAMS